MLKKMKIRCLNCMQEYEQYSQQGICPYCGFKDGSPPKEAYHQFGNSVAIPVIKALAVEIKNQLLDKIK